MKKEKREREREHNGMGWNDQTRHPKAKGLYS